MSTAGISGSPMEGSSGNQIGTAIISVSLRWRRTSVFQQPSTGTGVSDRHTPGSISTMSASTRPPPCQEVAWNQWASSAASAGVRVDLDERAGLLELGAGGRFEGDRRGDVADVAGQEREHRTRRPAPRRQPGPSPGPAGPRATNRNARTNPVASRAQPTAPITDTIAAIGSSDVFHAWWAPGPDGAVVPGELAGEADGADAEPESTANRPRRSMPTARATSSTTSADSDERGAVAGLDRSVAAELGELGERRRWRRCSSGSTRPEDEADGDQAEAGGHRDEQRVEDLRELRHAEAELALAGHQALEGEPGGEAVEEPGPAVGLGVDAGVGHDQPAGEADEAGPEDHQHVGRAPHGDVDAVGRVPDLVHGEARRPRRRRARRAGASTTARGSRPPSSRAPIRRGWPR